MMERFRPEILNLDGGAKRTRIVPEMRMNFSSVGGWIKQNV